MAYVISMHGNGIANSLVSITLASIITGLIVMFGGRILRKLGEVGTHLIIRILGLFLMAVAIQTLGEMIFALIKSNFGA
jgi:small neutral amino acid transporter SnatA (MarC family)